MKNKREFFHCTVAELLAPENWYCTFPIHHQISTKGMISSKDHDIIRTEDWHQQDLIVAVVNQLCIQTRATCTYHF